MGEQEFAEHRAAFWRAAHEAQRSTLRIMQDRDEPQSVEVLDVERFESHALDDGRYVMRVVAGGMVVQLSLPAEVALKYLGKALDVAHRAAEVPVGGAYR